MMRKHFMLFTKRVGEGLVEGKRGRVYKVVLFEKKNTCRGEFRTVSWSGKNRESKEQRSSYRRNGRQGSDSEGKSRGSFNFWGCKIALVGGGKDQWKKFT